MGSQKSNQKNSRRDFLKKSAVASSVFILPRHVLGGTGFTAPSDQMNIAAIGAGGKGRSDLVNATVKGRERVAALCDVHLGGNHGVKQTMADFPKAKLYENFKQMLDNEPDIDAVTISTPDHMHAPAAVYAMERGKHVYVQKPLTHNIREARMLTEMAREKKVITQMGNQGASNPDQLTVQKWFNAGLIGTVREVKVWTNRPVWPQGIPMPQPDASKKPADLNWDLWLGVASKTDFIPGMHPFNWRGWWEYGTGALGDMGCHIIDVPFKALGLHYPTDVECSVGSLYSQMWQKDYYPQGAPLSTYVTLNFEATEKNPSPITMTWTDGGIRPPHPEAVPSDEPLGDETGDNGVLLIGDKGVISSGVYGLNPKLFIKGGAMEKGPKIKVDEPEYGHQRKWIDACKAGFNSPEHQSLTSSFDYAGPMTETVLMGNIAIRSYMLRKKKLNGYYDYYGRKKLLWDGDNMVITNLKEANQFVTRQYRAGWEI